MFRFFFFQWTDSAVTVPTVEGLEYTLLENKLHFTLSTGRLHYEIPDRKLHYSMEDEDA